MRKQLSIMRFLRRILLASALILTYAPVEAATSAQTGVSALLARSASAWNAGDLDTFMQTYENSPQTVYISSTAVIHGYAAIRARYAGHYHRGQMGTLSVSDLVVRPLGVAYATAHARWHVARSAAAGGNLSGLFTLVLHRNAGGWHIIADHTP